MALKSYRRDHLPPHLTYYASGSNHPGEILGFAVGGVDFGVAAPEVNSLAEAAIVQAAARGARCFLDSGAFSEVEFGAGGMRVVAEIGDQEWRERLALALRLALEIGPLLTFVAPDRVGDQVVTLDRLARYSSQVRAIAEAGAEILLPCQKGALDMATFFELAAQALGLPGERLVPAIPMKKDATSLEELGAFLDLVRPARIHLLGLGPRSPRFGAVERVAMKVCGTLSCDSVAITALVGRGKDGRRPRPLTAAQDAVRAELEEHLHYLHHHPVQLDYTDSIAIPSTWASPAELRRLAGELALTGAAVRGFVADPDGWLQGVGESGEARIYDPLVELALDAAWRRYVLEYGTVTYRKRVAIEDLCAE